MVVFAQFFLEWFCVCAQKLRKKNRFTLQGISLKLLEQPAA